MIVNPGTVFPTDGGKWKYSYFVTSRQVRRESSSSYKRAGQAKQAMLHHVERLSDTANKPEN